MCAAKKVNKYTDIVERTILLHSSPAA